jgi:hypothetical protein
MAVFMYSLFCGVLLFRIYSQLFRTGKERKQKNGGKNEDEELEAMTKQVFQEAKNLIKSWKN